MESKPYYDDEVTYWRYYDTPDGQDMFKKAAVCAKYGAITGFIFSTLDVLMYSHPIGIGNIIKRYMALTLPIAGMGATFALVANTVQNLRQEDDILNYLAGGVAAAPLFGAYHGTKLAVFVVAVGLGVAGMTKKACVDEGYVFFPPFRRMTYCARPRPDWSITPELMSRGFTTNLPGEGCIPMPPPPKPFPPGGGPCAKPVEKCLPKAKGLPPCPVEPQYPCPPPKK